jgi:phenylacetate-CoA ligase
MLRGMLQTRGQSIPYHAGWALSRAPYGVRLPFVRQYRHDQRQARMCMETETAALKSFVTERVAAIADYAYEVVPFYREIYSESGFVPGAIRTFSDIDSLPIVNKSMLQTVPLEDRSAVLRGRYTVNTGGSSGTPLEFYITPRSIGREWAHMDLIWASVGYRSSDLKLSFNGRADIDGAVAYDGLRHQYAANLYSDPAVLADRLLEVCAKRPVAYIHGYPSAIFDFILMLRDNDHPLLQILRGQVKALLLGSERPNNSIRTEVTELLQCDSVSWYGHTERGMLAAEVDDWGAYAPFHSYGFAEAVPSGGDFDRLICTGYYGWASPFIRYDTGDRVSASVTDGLVRRFAVTEGREGDFILGRDGKKISLTALIFGRHHPLFAAVRHLQVRQIAPGQAEILVVPRRLGLTTHDVASLFDASRVPVDFQFSVISRPHRTVTGKVPLLILKT